MEANGVQKGFAGQIVRMVFGLFILQLLVRDTVGESCKKISSCSCKFDNGDIIDLTPLAHTDGTARFKDVAGTGDTYYYSYNPCHDFSDSGDCDNVAMCQKTSPGVGAKYYDLGDQNSAEFVMQGNDIILQYLGKGQFDPTPRTSKVKLVCQDSSVDNFIAHGEDPKGETTYTFELHSSLCCYGTGGLSVGSVLCIIFFVAVTVYLVGGVLYMKFAKNETGINLIPHWTFWVSVPGLIKVKLKVYSHFQNRL
ncbi:cation-dependent mannose-6-phosphate receptor-like [Glandiceps talaboti]